MMHNPTALAAIARRAGFVGDDVKLAVACALAATGGDDAYDMRAGMAGAGHWRGLWALNVDRYPTWDTTAIKFPNVAAAAAKVLCDRRGDWSWCDAYNAGGHVAHMHTAGVAHTREYDNGTSGTPVAIVSHVDHHRLWRGRFAGTFADTLTAAQHRRMR